MSISGLLNSLWNPKNVVPKNNKNNMNINNMNNSIQPGKQDIYSGTNISYSVPILQGKEYILYKQSKIKNGNNGNNANTFNENSLQNSRSIREGFNGMIGPSQANKKNQTDSSNLQSMEDAFNRSISSYANSHKNLMDKSQQFLQGKRSYGKNIHPVQAANTDDIIPNWVGCYKSGNDGLVEQTDLGNNTNITDCKVRASDLGYNTFALRQKGTSPGNTCFVGNSVDKAQSGGLATKSVLSYSFKKADGANTGGLMMNGQIGMYEDDITNNLVTDLNAVANCDISIGGKINPNTPVATYGYNCNGTQKSPYTAPPPQPVAEIPTPGGYTKYSNKDSGGNDIIKMADGTSLADLAATCDKNLNCSGFNSGGWVKAVINPQTQWDSPTYNGKLLDLYVKNKNTLNIDTTKQYRLKDVNSSNCLYNNSDGRFSTFQCIAFNDQYWTLTAVPGQTNTYMFKGVNSQYSLYADTNGQFRTAISDINNPTQQWELVPISGQTDTYQLKNKKTSTCLYNNADGRFNMSGCVAAYNDQWWKLIPISTGPKPCNQYSDTDTNLPDECYAQMWKEAGCTAPVLDDTWWKQQTKAVAKNDIYLWSTETDSLHRNACYAPVPVIKTGSTVNTGSLWSKHWTPINDGTWANSLSQLNDGSIACTNGNGSIYTRPNLSTGWTQQSVNDNGVKCVIQTQDGRYLGIGNLPSDTRYNNQLYIKNKLSDLWQGYQANPVTEQTVYGNNGTTSCGSYCYGWGNGQSWNNELPPDWAGAYCSGSNLPGSSCSTKPGLMYGLQCKCTRDDSIPYAGTTYNTSRGMAIPDQSNIGIISIIQLNNGLFIAVGTDNSLYKKSNLAKPWVKITCPQSCCVIFISILNDGSMVGVGTNGLVYTRKTLDSGWVLVDSSMQMSSVTQLKDGTILGTSQSGNFFRK